MANKLKIKKGDRVKVITGGSKGKVGDVLRVLPKEHRVVVSGVNMIKRHTKPSRAESGGIIEREATIHVSNVALVDPETKKPTRVGFRTEQVTKDGVTKTIRVRYAKKSGKDL